MAASIGRLPTAPAALAAGVVRAHLPVPQMIEREAAAERLRHEVGSLEAAKLTAEAMASRLEEMNALSMRVRAEAARPACVDVRGALCM